jgi:hypothetical protein
MVRVAYSNGRWHVTESGGRNVVSCFGERRDAMEYAHALVERTSANLVIQ